MAAQSLVSLKLETAEYESNIKRAQQGLLAMEKECRSVNDVLINLDKSQLEYVRSLGSMETKSQTAKGKVAELTSAFTELRALYNRLSQEEKQGDFGIALNQTLDVLKTRAQEAQSELKNIQGEISNSGNILDQLSGKFGINIKQLAGWGAAIAAAKGAMTVLKDAFFTSETNVDNWGRTMEAATAVYDSFLISIESGNFSNFFSNMDNLIEKARDAYNALDELGTKMTIINPERVKLQGQISQQKEIIRKQGKDSTAGRQAQNEIRRLEPLLKQTYYDESKMNYNAFEAKVREKLAAGGLTLNKKSFDFLMKSFSDTSAFEQLRKGAITKTVFTGKYNLDELGKPIGSEIIYEIKNTNQKLLDLFTDEWRKENSPLLTASYSAKNAAAMQGVQNARYLKTPTTGGGKSTGKTSVSAPSADVILDMLGIQQGVLTPERTSYELPAMSSNGINGFISMLQKQMANADLGSFLYKSLESNLVDATSFKELFTTAMQEGIDFASLNVDPKELWERIASGKAIPDEVWEDIASTINEKMGEGGITFDVSTGNVGKDKKNQTKNKNSVAQLSKAMSGLSQTLSGIQQMGIEIPQGIQNVISFGQGLVQAIQGISTIITLFGSGAQTANTVALDANTIALGILTTAIYANSATNLLPFANGGIVRAANGFVGGNSFSGDNIGILANSGELILNKAQQGNIASQLESGGQQSQVQPWLQGETIYLGMNNALRRMGKGEIVTTSMLKNWKR